MKTRIILALISLYAYNFAHAQSLSWTKTIYSQDYQIFDDMQPDNDGNLIITGKFDGNINFAGVAYNSKIYQRYFIAKFDTAGHLAWIKVDDQYSGGNGVINCIEISKKDDYFFSGPLYPGNNFLGIPSKNLPKENSFGFIAKSDRSGNIKWIRKYIDYKFVNTGYLNSTSGLILNFKIDKYENVYFTGYLNDSASGNYMTIGNKKYYAKDGQSFVTSFDSSGKLNWITFDTLVKNALYTYSTVELDSNQNVYVAAIHYDKNGDEEYFFLEKYNNKGEKLLTKRYSPNNHLADPLRIGKDNDLYLSLDSITPPQTIHTCVIRLDTNFNQVWVLLDKGAYSGRGVNHENISINRQTGYLYLTGGFNKNMDLGSVKIQTAPGDTLTNLFIAKIDPSGHAVWIKNSTKQGDNNKNLLENALSVEDACGNFYALIDAMNEVHFEGINIDNTGYKNKFITGFLAKFSSDSLGFKFLSNTCSGLSLKNISKPAFKKFEWFAAKYPGDNTIGKLISTTRNLNYQFPHKGRYIITMQGIKAAGCTNLTRDTFYVAGSPVAGFMAADSQGCQYVNYNFSDTSHADSINAAIGESWYWDFGDQSTPLTYTKTKRNMVSHVYTQSGTYTVKLVYSNGICSDTFVSAQKVKIIPAPRPGFVLSTKVGNSLRVDNFGLPDTLKGCAPLDIKLTDKSDGTAKKWLYTIRPAFAKAMAGKAGDSVTLPAFPYKFLSHGIYVIHQYLTGITGCVTEDSVYLKVNAGVSPNDKPVILRATFNTKNTIDLHWLPMPGAKKYDIFRTKTTLNSSTTTLLKSTTDTATTDNEIGSLFPSPQGEGLGVRYSIQATDSCANRSTFSNIARPIILTGKCIDNRYFLLNWSPYEKWQNGVYAYEIEMQDPVTGNFGPIKNNPPNDTLFKDGDHFTNTSLVNCYRIKATEQRGYNQISYSNTICVPYLPALFVPNIFSPDGNGLNDSFKIVTIGIKNYSLTVYNRWGEVVYSGSENLAGLKDLRGLGTAGWDGYFKGQPAPEGIYLYTITAHGLDQNFYQKGTIELVR